MADCSVVCEVEANEKEDVNMQVNEGLLCQILTHQHKVTVKTQAKQPTDQFFASRTAAKISCIGHIGGFPNTQTTHSQGKGCLLPSKVR